MTNLRFEDGTYSAVRQNLFKVLEAEGKLPKEDKGQLKVGFTCMVGVTKPLDPEKYPELKDNFAHFKTIVGGVRHSVSYLLSSIPRHLQ